MQLTTDLSQLAPDVRNALIRKLRHEDKARYDMGVIEQQRMARLYRNAPTGAFKADLGPAQFVMSEDQWHRAMQKYGQHIFMDPDFVPWLQKHNDDMRVKQSATKIQVGYRG
jgi:hypothetical protein